MTRRGRHSDEIKPIMEYITSEGVTYPGPFVAGTYMSLDFYGLGYGQVSTHGAMTQVATTGHSSGGGNFLPSFTAPRTAIYDIGVSFNWSHLGINLFELRFKVNGVPATSVGFGGANPGPSPKQISFSTYAPGLEANLLPYYGRTLYLLNAGDVLTVYLYVVSTDVYMPALNITFNALDIRSSGDSRRISTY